MPNDFSHQSTMSDGHGGWVQDTRPITAMKRRELFILGPEVFDAVTRADVAATAADMKELGIFNLPYERIDLMWRIWLVDRENAKPDMLGFSGPTLERYESQMSIRPPTIRQSPDIERLNARGLSMIMHGLNRDGDVETITVKRSDGEVRFAKGAIKNAEFIWGPMAAELLIVLLATRNAEKTVSIDKLAKLGIGKKKHPYARSTTITISRNLPADTEHAPTGETRCPHLRRGHIRRQHYGPQRAFIKKIWIEPMFINADPDFVSQRRGYNFSIDAVDLPKAVDDESIVAKILNPDVGVQS